MAVYRCDNGEWVIASKGVWLPGAYEDERAAKFAFRLPDVELEVLRVMSNQRGSPITWGDIAKAAAASRARALKEG